MKNLYYKNNKLNKKVLNKNFGRFQNYIPIMKKKKPKFSHGDLVLFKNSNSEGTVMYHEYDKTGELIYWIKCEHWWSEENIKMREFEIYLKPLTRMVLIEKVGRKILITSTPYGSGYVISGTSYTIWESKFTK